RALSEDPKRADTYVDLGMIHAGRRDFKAAETAFRKGLENNPKLGRARIALAQLYVAAGDETKAEEELLLATKEDPENENLLHILGSFYRLSNKLDELEKIYLELLKKKPDLLIGKKRLAEVYLAKADVKKLQPLTDEILKVQPADPDALYFRGRINLVERNGQKATEDLVLVTKASPKFAPGYYYLGQAQLLTNRPDEAKKSFVRSTELSSTWVLPRLALAQLHFGYGDADLALEQSDLVLQRQPKN